MRAPDEENPDRRVPAGANIRTLRVADTQRARNLAALHRVADCDPLAQPPAANGTGVRILFSWRIRYPAAVLFSR